LRRKERDASRGSPRFFTAQRTLVQDDSQTAPLPGHAGIELMELGKLLVIFGVTLVVVGVVVMALGRMNFPLGRLPGDFLYRGKNTTVYFPLATSVVVSVVLTVVLYLVSRWRR
jgi:hypothetical protein